MSRNKNNRKQEARLTRNIRGFLLQPDYFCTQPVFFLLMQLRYFLKDGVQIWVYISRCFIFFHFKMVIGS